MKTTVRLSDSHRVTHLASGQGQVYVCHEKRVSVEPPSWQIFLEYCMTADQAGACIFGVEQALDVIDQRHRAAIENMRATA